MNGTYEFVKKSALPLHHKFAVSQLTISPIIHGPPSQQTLQEHSDKTYIEALTRRAVVKNRSNCIVVYQHNAEGEPFFSTNLHTLFTDPENNVSRDQVVIVANIGLATSRSEVLKRLSEACQHTGMEMVDIVMFEVSLSRRATPQPLTKSHIISPNTAPIELAPFLADLSTFVQITEAVNEAYIEETIASLQDLCLQGAIQSFGIQVAVAPYTYHKPAYER